MRSLVQTLEKRIDDSPFAAQTPLDVSREELCEATELHLSHYGRRRLLLRKRQMRIGIGLLLSDNLVVAAEDHQGFNVIYVGTDLRRCLHAFDEAHKIAIREGHKTSDPKPRLNDLISAVAAAARDRSAALQLVTF
jgi:hypothetical protein